LPSVSSSKPKGGEAVVEDQTHVQADVDANFRETVTRAMTRIETKEVREKPTLDDQNKTFRTRLVAMWMLTNAGLAIAIENINGIENSNSEKALQTRQSTYFSIILYSTFGLAAVRFIGVCFLSQFDVGISLKNQFSAFTTSSNETCFDASVRTSRASSVMIRISLLSWPARLYMHIPLVFDFNSFIFCAGNQWTFDTLR
jgi:hypothetical protein